MPEISFVKRLALLACALSLLTLALSGCATMLDPEASQEYAQDVVATLEPGQAIGQTFVVRRANLNGIYLWLNAEPQAQGSVTLKLYTAPEQDSPLAAVTILQSALTREGPSNLPLALRIPPAKDRATQPYYLVIQANGSPIRVMGRNEDAYPAGNLYRLEGSNATPAPADLAFRLSYQYDLQAMGNDITAAGEWLWLILPLGAVLVLPGWLLLEATRLRQGYDMGEQIALSVGLSLAIIPLLLLWSTILRLRWNPAIVSASAILLLLLSLWRWGKQFRGWLATRLNDQLCTTPRQFQPQKYLLLLVFAFTVAIRLAMVRDLAAPAWVDSVHHATITRLILDQGQFPSNYLPYVDVNAQEYHAGYHAGLAAFLWLAGSAGLGSGMLIYGQVLNALSIFIVYGLAKLFTRSPSHGVLAALIVGTLTPMPAYYTSWGRYTQLAGQLILPVVIVCFEALVQPETAKQKKCGYLVLLVVAASGMFIVHYRVAAYSALLMLALFLGKLRPNKAENFKLIRQTMCWALIAGALAFLVAAPWVWPTLSNVFAPIIAKGGTPGKMFADFSWNYLLTAMGAASLWLAGVGLLWGTLRRQPWVVSLALWMALLLFMANLGPIGVPGASVFSNNTSVTITFFIPIALFGGYAVSQAYQAGKGLLPAGLVKFSQASLSLLLFFLALAGAQKLLPILRPSTMLFRTADYEALEWIRTNIPPDETVLINPFLWGYNLYAGSDGGFWISPLAEHRSLPPPVLYGMNTSEEIQRINDVCQGVIENGKDADALWQILKEQAIGYVYVGVRGGPISPAALRKSVLFETLYEQDGTWVFQVSPGRDKP